MTQPIAQASKVGKGNTLHTSKKVEGQVFERLLTNTLEKKHQLAENSSPVETRASLVSAEPEEEHKEISREDSSLNTVESTEEPACDECPTYLSPYQGVNVSPAESDWTVTARSKKRNESCGSDVIHLNQEERVSLLDQPQSISTSLSNAPTSTFKIQNALVSRVNILDTPTSGVGLPDTSTSGGKLLDTFVNNIKKQDTRVHASRTLDAPMNEYNMLASLVSNIHVLDTEVLGSQASSAKIPHAQISGGNLLAPPTSDVKLRDRPINDVQVVDIRASDVQRSNIQVSDAEVSGMQTNDAKIFEEFPPANEDTVDTNSRFVEVQATKRPFGPVEQDTVHTPGYTKSNNAEFQSDEIVWKTDGSAYAERTLESGRPIIVPYSSDVSDSALEELAVSDKSFFSGAYAVQHPIGNSTSVDAKIQPEEDFDGIEEAASQSSLFSEEKGIKKENTHTSFEKQAGLNTHSGGGGHTDAPASNSVTQEHIGTTSVQEVPEVLKELSVQAVSSQDGVGTFETTLHVAPDHLGKLTIQIQKKPGSLEALITVEKAEAKEMLEKQWESIQHLLSSTNTKQVLPLLQKIDIQLISQEMGLSGDTASFEQRQQKRHVSRKRHTFSKKTGHKKDTLNDSVGLKTGRISLLV